MSLTGWGKKSQVRDQRSLKCLRAMSEREIDGVSDLVRGRRPAGMSVEMMAHPRLQRKEERDGVGVVV